MKKFFSYYSYIILGETMKIEKTANDDYIVYVFSGISNPTNIEEIKEFIKKIKKKLKINGFYKVIVCIKTIGCFMELKKLEEAYYDDTLDLSVVFHDYDIYFKTRDYFLLEGFNTVRYFEGEYYGLVDDSFDKILEKVEFGEFVYSSKRMIDNSCLV